MAFVYLESGTNHHQACYFRAERYSQTCVTQSSQFCVNIAQVSPRHMYRLAYLIMASELYVFLRYVDHR